MNPKELASLLAKLGASDPDASARSQIEGVREVARYLFLRQAWRAIVDENDPSWIERAIGYAAASPMEPYAGVGPALRKLRALGASEKDLTDLVRGMQAQLLFYFCYLLEDPGDVEPEVAELSWSFVEMDEEGNVIGDINGLHESVLETDPTGREMRPRAPIVRES